MALAAAAGVIKGLGLRKANATKTKSRANAKHLKKAARLTKKASKAVRRATPKPGLGRTVKPKRQAKRTQRAAKAVSRVSKHRGF